MPTPRRPGERLALLALRDAFPQAFPAADADLQPLALSTRDDLAAWAATRPDLNARHLRQALQHHCARTAYRRTLTAGRPRITLQGTAAEPVTEEAAQLARAEIAERQAARAQAETARLAAAAAHRRQQEAAAQRRAAQAAKPPKAKPPKQTAAPAPRPAVVVVKKRRAMPSGA